MNNAGDVAFLQSVSGPGFTNAYALFAGPPDDLKVVARTGQRAPVEGRDLTYRDFAWVSTLGGQNGLIPPDPLLDDSGQVLYTALFNEIPPLFVDGDVRYTALFAGPTDAPRPLLLDRTPVPGGPEGSMLDDWPTFIGMSGDGKVALINQVQLSPSVGTDALFVGTTDSIQPVLWAGRQAPGLPEGVQITSFLTSFLKPSPAVNASGQVVLTVGLSGNGKAIYAGPQEALRPVARQGDVAAGMDGVAVYGDLTHAMPVINDEGQIAFAAAGVTPDGSVPPQSAIYFGTPESVRPAVRTGDGIPGTPWRFESMSSPVLSSNGLLAFLALLGDGQGVSRVPAVVSGRAGAGDWRIVARAGQPAPGTAFGTQFTFFDPPSVNAAGNVVFGARLSARVQPAHDAYSALFASDPTGRVRIVARSGFPIDVDGETWNCSVFQFEHTPGWDPPQILLGTGGQDGRPHILTDSGQFIFRLHLTPVGTSIPASTAVVVADLNGEVEPRVLSRRVFYYGGMPDRGSSSALSHADSTLATDKSVLLPGQSATFANVNSYTKGVNGVMLDFLGLRNDLTAEDFSFEVGRGGASGWSEAPGPSQILRRPGQGARSSDRVEIVWPDGAIRNTWLRVTLKANANTGLPADDVFYFGNLVGETGDAADRIAVTAADLLFFRRPSMTMEQYRRGDFDRNGNRTPADWIAARRNLGRTLALFTAPLASAGNRGAVEPTPIARSTAVPAAGARNAGANLLDYQRSAPLWEDGRLRTWL